MEYRENNKITAWNPNMSTTTLKRSKQSIKKQGWSYWIEKEGLAVFCLMELHFTYKGKNRLREKYRKRR